MIGAAKAGLVLTTINPVLEAAEVEYILRQGDVQVLFFMAKVRGYGGGVILPYIAAAVVTYWLCTNGDLTHRM